MSKRPLIAIAPQRESYIGDDPTYVAKRRYLDYIEEFGATPFIMTYGEDGIREQERQLMELADGFMLLGGDLAIAPSTYGDETVLSETSKPPYRRDRDICEQEIVRYAYDSGKPILGICRGMQIMNVALGGTLYQDISLREDNNDIEINHAQFDDRLNHTHTLHLSRSGLMHKIIGESEIGVNSIHKQAVKEIGNGLAVCAMAPDGVIEGIYAPGHKFMLGIQFHPSFVPNDPVSIAIGEAFVDACRG